jgi:hypothetical protein
VRDCFVVEHANGDRVGGGRLRSVGRGGGVHGPASVCH